MLGVHPLLGRDFLDSDDRPGAVPVVMLSNALWKRRFGSDPGIIGRNINLDDRTYVVAGVLPPDFRFLYARDAYVPIGLEADKEPNRGVRSVARVLARLKPNASIQTAASELKTVAHRLEEAYPDYDGKVQATVRPFTEPVAAPARRGLLTLSIGVGFLLLIACANVASLLLARASSRQREIAIRVALGAGRRRLISQLLTESALLAFAGAAAGLATAAVALPLLSLLVPVDQGEMEQYVRATLNLRVLSFTVFLTVVTTLACGLVPARRMSPTGPDPLRSGTRATSAGFRKLSLRSLLVTMQIALSVILLVGAGLLAQSLLRLLNTSMGFRADHLLTARLKLPSRRYPDNAGRSAFFDALINQLDTIPGVRGQRCNVPAAYWKGLLAFRIPHRRTTTSPPGEYVPLAFQRCRTGLFEDHANPSHPRKRSNEHYDLHSEQVVLVNQSFVRKFFSGNHNDPVGRRIPGGIRREQKRLSHCGRSW